MSEGNRLLKNTAIIALGSVGTKLITFLMLPLFTFYLTTEEFGIYDYIQISAAFLLPFLTMLMEESMFRFLIDSKSETESTSIITNAFVIVFLCIIVFTSIVFVIYFFIHPNYCWPAYFYSIATPFTTIVNAFFRGKGQFKLFTIHNIIISLAVTLFNVVIFYSGHCSVSNILFASAFARLLISLFMSIYYKIWKNIKINCINYNLLKEMFVFSWPLIPNRIAFAMQVLFDRSAILFFLGSVMSGYYAVVCKVTLLIVTIYSFFGVSWQESASRALQGKNVAEYYSNVFSKMYKILLSIIFCTIAFTPIFFKLLIDYKFYPAMNYVPFILIATYFNCIAVFLGGILIAFKDTKSMGTSMVLSFSLQVIGTYLLIDRFGLYSIVISSIFSNFVLAGIRLKFVLKLIKLNVPRVKDVIFFIVIWGIITFLFFIKDFYINILNILIVLLFLFYILYKTGVLITIKNIINKRLASL